MDEFDEVFSFDHLYKSYKRCLKGKRNKREVIEYSFNLSSNLWKLFYELRYHKYKVDGYKEFTIYDPKTRIIQAISFKDRIVQHCLVDYYLVPKLSKLFILDNCACQKNKGTFFAIKRLRHHLTSKYSKNYKYYLKLDVKKFFDNISHDEVKKIFNRYVDNEKILNLLFNIIDSFNYDTNKGFPMGNQTSQFIALLFLSSLDHAIKEKFSIKGYIRYMDDIIILFDEKEKANEIFGFVKEELDKIKLELNKKSQIHTLGEGIEFLGWRFKVNNSSGIKTSLRRSTKNRITAKIKDRKSVV